MASRYQLSASSVLATTPQAAYDALVDAPLEELFGDRSGPIPPVRECRGQQGPWGQVGQTRTVVLGDGGTVLETLVVSDRAAGDYRYRLSEITGPMKALARSIDGRFAFVPADAGTTATWTWDVHLTSPLGRLAMPVFKVFWQRAAGKAFTRLGSRLAA
jgi:Polyketide cyclase / dehydrase and lipid transport